MNPTRLMGPAAMTAAAALLEPLLAAERRAALADAVARSQQGHARDWITRLPGAGIAARRGRG